LGNGLDGILKNMFKTRYESSLPASKTYHIPEAVRCNSGLKFLISPSESDAKQLMILKSLPTDLIKCGEIKKKMVYGLVIIIMTRFGVKKQNDISC